jgi:hypothetical protein
MKMKNITKDRVTVAAMFLLPVLFISLIRTMRPESASDMKISGYVSEPILKETEWFDNEYRDRYRGKGLYIGGATITLYEIVDPEDIKIIESVTQKAINEIGGKVSLFFYEKQNLVERQDGSMGSRKREKLIHKSTFKSKKKKAL